MEDIYMAVIKFFTAYGWQMTVLAVSGIFLLGVLKSFKAFDWIKIYSIVDGEKTIKVEPTKQLKKVVYTVISAGLSVIACCIYLKIVNTELTATLILTLSGTIWSMNTITYMLYENFGVRAVWKTFLAKAKTLFINTTATIRKKIESEKEKAAAEKIAKDAQKSVVIVQNETAKPDITEQMKNVAEYIGIDTSYLEMLKKLKK